MITLLISSQKGGVGKTTVAINLAHSLACRGWQTLLIDTDPQNAVGLSLSDKTRKSPGYYDLLHHDCPADELIIPTRLPELHLMTAGRTETYFQLDGDAARYGPSLDAMLGQLRRLAYDVLVVDTAAGLSGHTRQIARRADHALLPQQAEPLGARSMVQLLEEIHRLQESAQGRPAVAGILLTMVDPHSEESMQVARELREMVPETLLLRSTIPRDRDFIRASSHGVPVGLLYRNPPAVALVFDQLAAELEPRIGLHPNAHAEAEITRLLD